MFQWIESRTGEPVLKYNGKPLHSLIDPVKESLTWAKSLEQYDCPYIVLGSGVGYPIIHFISLLQKDTPYLIICFDPIEKESTKNLCLQHNILINLDWLVLYNDLESIQEWFSSVLSKIDTVSRLKVVEYYPSTRIFKTLLNSVKSTISILYNYTLQNQATKLELGSLWVKNLVQNISFLEKQSLKIKLEGGVVLISAGPSLNTQIKDIQILQKSMPIAVVDTALPVLLQNNIIPDIVFSCDSQVANYYDFFEYKNNSSHKETYLIADITHYPMINRFFQHIVFYMGEASVNSIFEKLDQLLERSLPLIRVKTGGSVASFALSVLYHLGASDIFLVGQDLAYQEISHAKGSIFYSQSLFKQDRFNSFWNDYKNLLHKEKDDPVLNNLAVWINQFFQHFPVIGHHKNRYRKLEYVQPYSVSNIKTGNLKLMDCEKKIEKKKLYSLLKMIKEDVSDLRLSSDMNQFLSKRANSQPILYDILNIILAKPDLYKERIKDFQQDLYLGSCFNQIDRLNKALQRALINLR